MKSQILQTALLATGALAARPFLNEAETGIELALGDLPVGELPPVSESQFFFWIYTNPCQLDAMVGLPDFEWAARNFMSDENYTYYRNGAGGEWAYRNNLEIFHQYRFRPRSMVDVSNIESTLPTTILGHNFSAPFYISACARAGHAHPDAELNFVKGAGEQNILYMVSNTTTLYLDCIVYLQVIARAVGDEDYRGDCRGQEGGPGCLPAGMLEVR